MTYFAVLLPMKDEKKSKEFRQEHLDFLEKMRAENRVFLFGRLVDGAGGLIIYQGDNRKEIETLAQQDPYVTTGARGFEIHEWDVQTDYTFTK